MSTDDTQVRPDRDVSDAPERDGQAPSDAGDEDGTDGAIRDAPDDGRASRDDGRTGRDDGREAPGGGGEAPRDGRDAPDAASTGGTASNGDGVDVPRRRVLGAIAAVAGSSVAAGVASADHEADLVGELSLDDKIHLVHGSEEREYITGGITALHDHGVPEIVMYDGPVGVRSERPQTAFPASIAAAASFDTDLMYQQGEAMGRETKAAGGHCLLGPALNIHRAPRCGRNFEYYSEDPYLSGEMAAASTEGIQAEDVVATPKHFAANNQEHERRTLSANVSERALREIYLEGFRKAVQEGGALSVMAAYNAVNGQNCPANEHLLTEVLRDDWGFDGYVVTDWEAMEDAVPAARAGTDLEMSGRENLYSQHLRPAVENGTVDDAVLDGMVGNVLHAYSETGHLGGDVGSGAENTQEHQRIARELAESGAVLLKNEGDVLPIDLDAVDSIAVVGEASENAYVGGEGAAKVTPPDAVTPIEGIREYVGSGTDVIHAPYNPERASEADVALAFGSDDAAEFEDRSDMRLDRGDDAIQRAADANPNTVAVLALPSPVEMPWLDDVASVLNVWYPGMEDGTATANLLFGEATPSGKLPTTFADEDQYPANVVEQFSGQPELEYDEGIYVGYRHFDAEGIEPTFEFGYGLSYTEFEYGALSAPGSIPNPHETNAEVAVAAPVEVEVTNVGDRAGAEVVQFYVAQQDPSVDRPPKELAGFDRVHLEPGETKTASADLGHDAFRFWHPDRGEWVIENDEFEVHAAASSRDLRSSATVGVGVTTSPCPDAAGGSATVDGQSVCDVNGDGLYRDANADGEVTHADVQEFFSVQHRPAWKQPGMFDFNDNDVVGHGDVIALFEDVATGRL